MDSAEDTTIATPADTSNPSMPESSSTSDDSRPTVELGSNVTREHDEHRNNDKITNEPRWRNDRHEPFFDRLDQDGRHLVEKTGRTAQRARSSVRPRLSRLDADKMEARINWSADVGRIPKKCPSATRVLDSRESSSGLINGRRRYSRGMERSRLIRLEPEATPERYSAGDYLRQQILEDLSSNELIGKTEEQIAEDRCNRVRAYLRRGKMDSSRARPEVRLRRAFEDRGWRCRVKLKNSKDLAGNETNAAGKHDLDNRIGTYLEDGVRKKMNLQERTRDWEMTRSSIKYPSEPSLGDRIEETTTRPPEIVLPIAKMIHDKFPRTVFSQGRKEKRAANGGCGRTRSDAVIPETVIDPDDGEVRKRFYSYSAGRRKSWRTRSFLTFEKKLSLPSCESSMNLDRDTRSLGGPSSDHDDNVCGKNRKEYRPTTRSETLTEKMTATMTGRRRAERRSVSRSDEGKLHRRRIDRDETSYDSEPDRDSCSWREYKEKRRIERRMTSRTERRSIELESSIRAASKHFPTRFDESRVGGDTTETPKVYAISANRSYEQNGAIVDVKIETSGPTITNDDGRKVGETNDDTETETILQENYLLVDGDEIERSRERDSSLSTISRLRVNEYLDPGVMFDGTSFDETSTNRDKNGGAESFVELDTDTEYNIPDFGYDTIPKRRGKNCDVDGERYDYDFKSRVKKSDTFKIVDGSEDALDDDCQKPMRMRDNLIVTSRRSSNVSKSSSNVLDLSEEIDDKIDRHCAISDEEIPASGRGTDDDASTRSSKDVARDYFRRVYEFLKERRKNGEHDDTGVSSQLASRKEFEASSSSSENERELRKRSRRPKKYKNRGEEIVGASPGIGIGVDDGWTVNPVDILKFRRPRLENANGHKRPRNPAPPVPPNFTINAKDIGKYFHHPNKENSGLPGNAVNDRTIELGETEDRETAVEARKNEMGSNLSRHSGKGLTGRRTQSSGNLCDPRGKLNHVGKILVPCSSSQRERYKIRGSLPNNLDDKEIVDDENPSENNNVISDTMVGNFGGTLPHKKRTLGVHFSDTGPTGTLDLVKHRSQDSLEGDPWRYQDGAHLDLVRCQHGNFDPVRKNESSDVVDGDASSGRRYGTAVSRVSESKCHRAGDLDLVGTLPKRRPGDPKGAALRQSLESRQNRTIDDDSSIKFQHKPDCELVKHRQFDRVVDPKLSRLIGGEPQDQGYASERSPEDEHPPSLPGRHFPNVNPESTFRVSLQKSSRGLGLSVSGGGTAGPVRVKRLFPQQPAALSNKLQSGDVLLAANGIPLTGLTNYEALEVLRTTPSTVELVVRRLPGDAGTTPPGAPPPPPARREPPPPPLRILNPLTPLRIEPCGEFDIEMTKVAGSLGFTLRKVDCSALGHYVRALVREPALSDGRIQPGDKIIAVDGATLSPMSHEEAVALLRQCGPTVKLRLYRDLAQTPVSALSPTEPDHPLRPSRTSLRQEAVDMLCDLAVRKLSPGTSNGSAARQTSGASCNSPRRLRRPPSRTPTADNEEDNHSTFHPVNRSTVRNTDGSEIDRLKTMDAQTADSQSDTPSNDIIDPPPLYDVCDSVDSLKLALRPGSLDLGTTMEKPHFQFNLESETEYTGPTIVTESHSNVIGKCADHGDDCVKRVTIVSRDEHDDNLPSEPASMPPLLSTTRTTSAVFSYKNPAYQSADPTCGGIDNSAKHKTVHSSDRDIPGKVLGADDPAGSKGLLKWKGVMFAPDEDTDGTKEVEKTEIADDTGKAEGSVNRRITSEDGKEVFMVELTRGWNSRLGFSLQPEGNSTVISVVHPDSVAAKDGRLKQGDVLILVNDESVEKMPTAEIIDLLRKIRGSIGITVMRKNKTKNSS